MDAGGAIWTGVGPFGDSLVGRVRDGGEVLERVRLDMPCFACMLGGEDRRTLFMLTADWRMDEGFDDNIARLTSGPRTGRLLTAPAPAPGRRMAVAVQGSRDARRLQPLLMDLEVARGGEPRRQVGIGVLEARGADDPVAAAAVPPLEELLARMGPSPRDEQLELHRT